MKRTGLFLLVSFCILFPNCENKNNEKSITSIPQKVVNQQPRPEGQDIKPLGMNENYDISEKLSLKDKIDEYSEKEFDYKVFFDSSREKYGEFINGYL